MAICRIGFGFSLVFHYVSIAINHQNIFGPDGLFGYRFYSTMPNMLAYDYPFTKNFLWLRHIENPNLMTAFFSIEVLAAFFYAIGAWPRFWGCIALILHSLLSAENSFAFWGWAHQLVPFMLYTLCSKTICDYSIFGRCSINYQTDQVWPVRLMQIHIAILYYVVGWYRIGDPVWVNGSALQMILSTAAFGRYRGDLMPWSTLLKAMTHLSWLLELSAPILLWPKISRKYYALALITMHLGLETLSTVGYWNFVMISALSVFAIPLTDSDRF